MNEITAGQLPIPNNSGTGGGGGGGHYRVNRQKLKSWLERRYGDVRDKGRHLLVNDPRGRLDGSPDRKFNLVFWPEGRCFKSWIHQDWHGGIAKFVMDAEGCDFDSAVALIGDRVTQRLDDETFNGAIADLRHQASRQQANAMLALKNIAALPPGFTLFSSDDTIEKKGPEALGALLRTRLIIERGIQPELFGMGYIVPHARTPVEIEGRWPDMTARVVAPYFDASGALIYWSARDMLPRRPEERTPRYFNMPLVDVNLEAAETPRRKQVSPDRAFIWCWDWSARHKTVYLSEGFFDAQSLCLCGLFALGISGAHLNENQLAMLRRHLHAETLVVAVDNDETGRVKRIAMARELQRHGWRVRLVSPPDGYKDWNAVWAAWRNPNALRNWIEVEESPLSLAAEVTSQLLGVPRL